MTQAEKLSNELHKSIFGDPWYGASAIEFLKGISGEQAFRKPIPTVHNIIELVLHITAWSEEILSRFKGNEPTEPQMGDWPTLNNYTGEHWEIVKQNFYDTSNKLILDIKKFPEEKLNNIMGEERNVSLGTGFSFEGLIFGLVEHNSYHLGQISLLKKFF